MMVTPDHTVPQVADWPGFMDMPQVFATAMMIGFMEQTCIQSLGPYLEEGQRTVGTHVNMSHVAATPVGMEIEATVELVEIQVKALTFKVACHDAAGLIGEGLHRRAIIDLQRFEQRLSTRKAITTMPQHLHLSGQRSIGLTVHGTDPY
jgi:fluoroacetyl-CoA thioesterase